MDPLTAVGLASNIVQMLELGSKLLKTAREIYSSATGLSQEDQRLATIANGLKQMYSELDAPGKGSKMSPNEIPMRQSAKQCLETATKLATLLEQLRAKDTSAKLQIFKAAFKGMMKRSDKMDLEQELNRNITVLNSHLLAVFRLECMQKLDQIILSNNVQKRDIIIINAQIENLWLKTKTLSLGKETIEQIQEVMDKSEQSFIRHCQRQIIDLLKFPNMETRSNGISAAHRKTLTWIFQENGPYDSERQAMASETLRKWLESGDGIFHVAGKPGSGKSTLIKYLSHHVSTEALIKRWAENDEVVSGSFFFWKAGTDDQKTFQGLARSLLHSIFSQAPELISGSVPRLWDKACHGTLTGWDSRGYEQTLEDLLGQGSTFDGRRIVFFIDGLDELEGNFSEMVKKICDWTRLGGSNLKICVSSREFAVFENGFAPCPRIQLQELTWDDISRYTHSVLGNNAHFQALEVSTDVTESFIKQLLFKAQGVFLWIKVVLDLLEEGLENGDEMRHLKQKAALLPNQLEDLFLHIFESINKADRPYVIRMVYFLADWCAGKGRLPLSQVPYLELVIEDQLAVDQVSGRLTMNRSVPEGLQSMIKQYKTLSSYEADEQFFRQLLLVRRRLMGRCKGLLEITNLYHRGLPSKNASVQVSHRSVRDFLREPRVLEFVAPYVGTTHWVEQWFRMSMVHSLFLMETNHDILSDCSHWYGKGSYEKIDLSSHLACEMQEILHRCRHAWSRGEIPLSMKQLIRDFSGILKHSQNISCRIDSDCSDLRIENVVLSEHASRNLRVPLFCASQHNGVWKQWYRDNGYREHGHHFSLAHSVGLDLIWECLGELLDDFITMRGSVPDLDGLVYRILSAYGTYGGLWGDFMYRERFRKTLEVCLHRDSSDKSVSKTHHWSAWHRFLGMKVAGAFDFEKTDSKFIFECFLRHGADAGFWLSLGEEVVWESVTKSKSDSKLEAFMDGRRMHSPPPPGGDYTGHVAYIWRGKPSVLPAAALILTNGRPYSSGLIDLARKHNGVLCLKDLIQYWNVPVYSGIPEFGDPVRLPLKSPSWDREFIQSLNPPTNRGKSHILVCKDLETSYLDMVEISRIRKHGMG